MSRKRGRITVQNQPTGAQRGMRRMMGVVHAIFGFTFTIVALTTILPHGGIIGLPFLAAGIFFTVNGIRMAVAKNDPPHRVAYDVETDMAQSIVGMMEEPPAAQEETDAAATTTEQRLLELQRLYKEELITQEEYQQTRRRILEEL